MKTDYLENTSVLFIAQFGTALSLSSIIVLLPFYIYSISKYSLSKTILWTGLILSASNIGAAIFSPIWGKLSSKINPKTLYLRGIVSHSIVLLLISSTQNLPLLLLFRFIQGIMGGISTIGLIILKSSVSQKELSPQIGKFQSSITLGQLFGPPIGAYIAYKFSYFSAFILASSIMALVFIFTAVFLNNIGKEIFSENPNKKIKLRYLELWFLSFSATIHTVYLPAILPTILSSFNYSKNDSVITAGVIVFIYGISSFCGAYLLPSLPSERKIYNFIVLFSVLASLFQLLHLFAENVYSFTTMRVVQTFFAAAIMPLCLGIVANRYTGTDIGILNTARFTGNAAAPLISTFILSFLGLKSVFLFLTLLTLLPLNVFIRKKHFYFLDDKERKRFF